MTDIEWWKLVKAGEDEGWKAVWERVIDPESRSSRSAGLMDRYSITAGDLMGMLYAEMIGRGKIDLYRGEGSFEGWLRRYIRGFILNANPNPNGEISIEAASDNEEDESKPLQLPNIDTSVIRGETWRMTLWCFRKLWNEDPERCYVHVLKTRFHLTSEEIRDFLCISSTANVDQIFSRSVKFMRSLASKF